MRRIITASAIAIAFFVPGAASADDESGTILVTATGFKSSDGQAIIALYKKGEHWLDIPRAYRSEKVPMTRLKKGTMRFKLRNVPYGEYGVTVLHDANSNGKLDMRWVPYPKPKEYGGISNNWVRNGKPEYSKAKFTFDRRIMSLRILMRK